MISYQPTSAPIIINERLIVSGKRRYLLRVLDVRGHIIETRTLVRKLEHSK